MDLPAPYPLWAVCAACGEIAAHHPFVKPGGPEVGLVCACCGQINPPGSGGWLPVPRALGGNILEGDV